MPTPFDNLGLKKANEIVNRGITPLVKRNRMFMEGDHFQGGDGWMGPTPHPGEPGGARAMMLIERGFVSKNVIAEITERHSSGVVGREPAWGMAWKKPLPPLALNAAEEEREAWEALDKERSDVEEWLTEWVDSRGAHELIQQVVTDLLWSGRSALRLYIPSGYLKEKDGETFAEAPDIPSALEMIWPDHPQIENARIFEDPDTKRRVSIFIYTKYDDPVSQKGGRTYAELTYLDEDREFTIVRTISNNTDTSYPIPMGGRLLMHEMERPLLVSTQIQQAQRALNLALSNIPRTVVTAGYLRETLLNAQMPGDWVDEQGNPTNPDENPAATFRPAPYVTGPNHSNFVQGITYTDEEGKTHITTPSIHEGTPVPATSSIDAKNNHYSDILDEADQLHVLMGDKATASGKSRLDARIDFLASLMITQPRVEALGRWLIESVLALAEAVSGQPGKYSDRMRGVYRCRLNSGALAAEEQIQLVERVEKGLLPKEWAMEMMGVDDVDAALELIEGEIIAQLGRSEKQALVFNHWVTAGLDHQSAGKLARLTPEQMEIITGSRGNAEDTAIEQ